MTSGIEIGLGISYLVTNRCQLLAVNTSVSSYHSVAYLLEDVEKSRHILRVDVANFKFKSLRETKRTQLYVCSGNRQLEGVEWEAKGIIQREKWVEKERREVLAMSFQWLYFLKMEQESNKKSHVFI